MNQNTKKYRSKKGKDQVYGSYDTFNFYKIY